MAAACFGAALAKAPSTVPPAFSASLHRRGIAAYHRTSLQSHRHSVLGTAVQPKRSAGLESHRHRSMATRAMAGESVTPVTIIGKGRVGQAFADMGAGADVLLGRGDPIQGPEGPIIVCTRNNDLQGVVDSTKPERREDLVFIQNGMLQPWLDSIGLGDNTQVLVYFAVAKLGDPPTDGKTDVNPEGLTAAYGKHAQAVADRLARGGLSCKVLDWVPFQRAMLEKLIWISAFMLVGAKHGCTVGEVEQNHQGDVNLIITELAAAGEAQLGITLDEGCIERLNAYARAVAHFPTAVKEFEWRNGFFYNISSEALKAGKPDPCPTHSAWLQEVGAI